MNTNTNTAKVGSWTVLAHPDGRAKTYANFTQAAAASKKIEDSAVYQRPLSRVFYVVIKGK